MVNVIVGWLGHLKYFWTGSTWTQDATEAIILEDDEVDYEMSLISSDDVRDFGPRVERIEE